MMRVTFCFNLVRYKLGDHSDILKAHLVTLVVCSVHPLGTKRLFDCLLSSKLHHIVLEMSVQGIHADLLIPGRGTPLNDGVVTFGDDGKILWVGEKGNLPDEYSHVSLDRVPVIMPGLWDCHVHFLGCKSYIFDQLLTTHHALSGARGAHDVTATLLAGFTTVRELCGYGVQLQEAINEGLVVGPRIYSSVSSISQTAGHCDMHPIPSATLQNAIDHGLPLCIADGVDECVRGVRTQIRRGAEVIKVAASGGVASVITNPLDQQFSDEELAVIVKEATRARLAVAAHCHGKDGIMAALRAGCTTIEHGSYLDDEAINLMIEKNAILVATRTVIDVGLKHEPFFTPVSYKKLQNLADAHDNAYKAAVRAGVRIALGSDLGISMQNTPFGHGYNGQELIHAVEAGMTPLQAIEAATANAPATLGPRAPLSGMLKAGYDADFIAVCANPLDDMRLFANPDNVTHVWRAGKLYKSPPNLV